MNCNEARSAIGPDLEPAPPTPEAQVAIEHYQKCEACRRFYANQIRLVNRLKQLNTARAPEHLRDRVLAAIDAELGERSPGQPRVRRRRWIASGLAAAAVALVAIWLSRPDATNTAHQAAILLAQTAHDSVAADQLMASDEATPLRSWLASRVGSSFEIPDIPDAQLTGGRVTQLDGVSTAAIRYQYRGMELVYFMIPASAVSRRMPDDDDLWSFTANGFELVLWREGATTRAVMAPMPRAELEAIAEQCRSKAMI